MLWVPVFTGMTMLMSSLRLRHSLQRRTKRVRFAFFDYSGGLLLTVRTELLLAVHGEPVEPQRQATGYQLISSL